MVITFTLLSSAACSHTLAEVPLFDGNILVIDGYGTKSRVSQKCLSEDVIKQLVNSSIPADVPKQPCYWVQIVSTDSSDISKAVTEFIRAENEFQEKIATLATPSSRAAGIAKATDPAAVTQEKEIAAQVVRSAVTKPTDQVVAEARNIPVEQKPGVKAQLQALRASATAPSLIKTLDAVIASP